MTGFLIRSIAVMLTVAALPVSAVAALPELGAPAPDFALRSSAGSNWRLSEFRTEVVVLNFWGSWCRSCRSQLQQLQLLDADPDMDVRVLSVFVDDEPDKSVRTRRELKLTFPFLFDSEQSVSRLYDLPTLPVLIFIDRFGNVRFTHRDYKAGDEFLYAEQLRELLSE